MRAVLEPDAAGMSVAVAAGALLLAVPTVVLYGFGVLGTAHHAASPVTGIALIAVIVGIVACVVYEWRFLRDRSIRLRPGEDGTSLATAVDTAVRDVIAILAGTLITLAGTFELGLSPIVSAGVVGVIAAVVVPRRDVAVYCGAFVGMTSPVLLGSYALASVAAGIAGVVFVLARPAFHGIGGKLGTTAFVGATVTVAATTGSFRPEPLPSRVTIVAVVAFAIVAAVVTFAVHTRTDASAVLASGAVGIVGGILLPVIHGSTGGLLAAAVFSASFAGMTGTERIPNVWWIAVAGLIVGLVVVYTTPYLGGSGGKLGTIAFGSCLAVHGLLRAMHLVRFRRRSATILGRDTT